MPEQLALVVRDDFINDLYTLDLLPLLNYNGWQMVIGDGDTPIDEALLLHIAGTSDDDLAARLQALEAILVRVRRFQNPLEPYGVWLRHQMPGETGARQALIVQAEADKANLTDVQAVDHYIREFVLGLKRTSAWEDTAYITKMTAEIGTIGDMADLGEVAGDIPARLARTRIDDFNGGMSPFANVWIGLRSNRFGIAANFVPRWEAELGHLASNVAVTTANDATATGLDDNKSIRVTFTDPTMQPRWWMSVAEAAEFPDNQAGRMLVLGRFKVSDGSTVCRVRLESGFAGTTAYHQRGKVVVSGTDWVIYPLGQVTLPETGRGLRGLSLISNQRLRISADRYAGSGTLDMDCLILIPTDEGFISLQSETTLQSYLDPVKYPLLISRSADDRVMASGYQVDSGFASTYYSDLQVQVEGGMPTSDHVQIVLAAQRSTGSILQDNVVLTLDVYQRWLTLRGAAGEDSNLKGVYVPDGWGAHWISKLAGASAAPAILALCGDSISRGYYSSALDAKAYSGLLKYAYQVENGDGGSGYKSVADTTFVGGAQLPPADAITLSGNWAAEVSKEGPASTRITANAPIPYIINGSLGNGGFETAGSHALYSDFADWVNYYLGGGTVTDETADTHGGSHAAKLALGNGGGDYAALWPQPQPCSVGHHYTFSFWAKSSVDGVVVYVFGAGLYANFSLTTSWVQYTGTFTADVPGFNISIATLNQSAIIDDVQLSDTGLSNQATALFSVRGSTVKIYWARHSTGGDFTYTIDGDTPVTVSTAGSDGVGITTITGLASISHSILITRVGTFTLFGCAGENATGVRVNNFSRPYATSNDVTQPYATYGDPADWSGGKDYPCDLLIYGMGINDVSGPVTPEQYITNVTNFLDSVATSSVPPDVLIVLPHGGNASNLETYALYESGLKALAASRGAAFISLWEHWDRNWNIFDALGGWGDASYPGASGHDNVHPSDSGHRLYYDAIKFLLNMA